jgi:signal transduction histidine kinase
MRGALIWLAVAGFLIGVTALVVALSSEHEIIGGPIIFVGLGLGWAWIATGLYAQWRRPGNRIGLLMTTVGFLWFVNALPESESALLFTIGSAGGGLWFGPFAHLLVAFPSGRVAPGLERWLVRLGYVIGSVQATVWLFMDPEDCPGCPANLLLIDHNQAVADALGSLFGLAGVGTLAVLGFVLVRRWRDSGPVQRQALSPVLWTGAAVAIAGILSVIPAAIGSDRGEDAMNLVLITLITAVPFAFLVGLLRSTLSRAGAVSGLVERFGAVSVRDALAEALGDPDLSLAYWLPRPGRWVDADGRPFTPPESRAVTEIEDVAAIVHDPALLEEPELVRAAGAAAALALRNERLDAELRARYEDLRASQARLVAAGDEARRRIERDLHDGAQQRLVSLALMLRLAARRHPDDPDLARAGEELTHALQELRELARGIHPAVLTERGLEAALSGLAQRSNVPVTVNAELDGRLPAAVETAAYFVISEALTNVSKYAEATAAEVSVRQANGHVVIDVRDDGKGGADPTSGSGLRGIADRVSALDGVLEVESPPGRGTLVRAELPTSASRPRPAR